MKKLFVCIFILTASLFVTSCGKKSNFTFSESQLVPLYDAGTDSAELALPTQTWHKSNDCVVVLFGYGYNDEEFVSASRKRLAAKYGDYDQGGRFLSFVFPDDFKHGTKTYITNLSNILSDKEVSALVILGAPEGTYKSIARLQDSYDGALPFPVISFFSQDEVLPMEDSSDFVLDKAQKAEINGIIANESTQDFVAEVPQLLDRALFLADISEAPFAKNAKLFEIVKMVTEKLKVSRYSDPETGLVSINHFVLD